jgi:Carboxypeptidase regulatory-like domain
MRMMRTIWTIGIREGVWAALMIGLALSLAALPAQAQTAGTGSIQGVVTDATGAVIPNATVVATSVATEVKHTAVTTGEGLYSFPNIQIGLYTLEATAAGFQGYKQSNIDLEVGSSISVKVTMRVGRADQSVEVQATGLALQTEDSSFKQTIDQRTLTELPLNGWPARSFVPV